MTLVDTYSQYRSVLASRPRRGRLMPYDWYSVPNDLMAPHIIYTQMLGDYARELANTINSFTRYVNSLGSWAVVIEPMTVNEKHEICIEFVDPIATIAIGLPYTIKARFAFAVAHLCHQANRMRLGVAWRDDLPPDDKISLNDTDRVGMDWSRYRRFKERLDRINGADFRLATHDFRNSYNHRLSPRVVVGLFNTTMRVVDPVTKAVKYTFGGTKAIDLEKVASSLEDQCNECYETFALFQELVREHLKTILPAP